MELRAAPQPRRTRANGEASRERILDAAAVIAGERGFEGTSIKLVSTTSGLPVSSIYWHFMDKDELIAAVIDRCFHRWLENFDRAVDVPVDASRDEMFRIVLRNTGDALALYPDFLRLGLMLILERRPVEPTARKKFVETRRTAAERIKTFYATFFSALSGNEIESLVTLSVALADGLFVAEQVEGLELANSFDLMATAILSTAQAFSGARSTTH